MTMPNFLIIGAAKTGTTSIYRYLKQHPQIYMSPAKEPRFFAFEGETFSFSGPGDEKETAKTDLESYRTLFDGVEKETAIGEASTLYLWSQKATERIQHYIPNAKLIAVLRDPVERAYSNYLHLVNQNREPLTDFAVAIAQEEERIKKNWWPFWYYKQQGFYYIQLQRYYAKFAQSQIKVYLYEDLKNDSLKMLQDIFQFLEVDDRFTPDLSQRVRQSRPIPKNKTLDGLMNKPNPLKSILKPLIPKVMRRQITTNLKKRNLTKPKLLPSVRQQLVEAYREDILQLQDLIERDLSRWLKY